MFVIIYWINFNVFIGPPHGILNVEVFQKIFLRVFAAGTTEDMKTELLKTIRAIFNIGTSRYYLFLSHLLLPVLILLFTVNLIFPLMDSLCLPI